MAKEVRNIVVIGAGIGGLTTAALLAKAGLNVTVLEAHIYPGGCAGTFYHQGYRFDAGATLAGGFYAGGPMDMVAKAVGINEWPLATEEGSGEVGPAMVVHLPNGESIARWGDERRWNERKAAFGSASTPFWQWQERTADALWALALQTPPWPPQSAGEAGSLIGKGLAWLVSDPRHRLHPTLLADGLRPVSAHLGNVPESLRLFVDAQLLIASQAISTHTNALYGASALDLPRRGVVHLQGGIGAIAETLVKAVRKNGGQVDYRQEVTRIVTEDTSSGRRFVAVETKRGRSIPTDLVIANLPPWNIARLLGKDATPRLRDLPSQPTKGGGAFMTYVGLDPTAIPTDFSLHHQVIVREPMGEGNTIFMSLSPATDTGRGPNGKRALTISTHTQLEPWWSLFNHNKAQYDRRKQAYTERLLETAGTILPGLRDAAHLIKPGTPVTFQRFTRRDWGWVGGFPQSDLIQAWGPRLATNLWMVGDTIFPGQSTAAVALGGMRVANGILKEIGVRESSPLPTKATTAA